SEPRRRLARPAALMGLAERARVGGEPLVRALLLFWALYFTVVTLSNLTDLLRVGCVLPAGFTWVPGNHAYIASSIARAGVPAGVIAWTTRAALLFWRALPSGNPRAAGSAFLVSLLRLLTAELATLVTIRLVGDGAATA